MERLDEHAPEASSGADELPYDRGEPDVPPVPPARAERPERPRREREEAPREMQAAREPAHVPPPAPAIPPAPPAAFHAVSEHDALAEAESHKPVRRRPRAPDAVTEAAPLQLVETQAPTTPIQVEDDLPRRTRPRRRREGTVAEEPLQLVETRGGEASQVETPPTP